MSEIREAAHITPHTLYRHTDISEKNTDSETKMLTDTSDKRRLNEPAHQG